METSTTQTIDGIVQVLGNIIQECESSADPLGYFAALYQRVTVKIKDGIENGFFEDGVRMEQLDIVFANRYIDAYEAYRKQGPATQSWEKSFALSKNVSPVVLQHLLMGINAHINLDLGIAAAEVSKGGNIDDLYGDFCKVNEVLSSLVNETQEELSAIWPALKWILGKSGNLDNYLVDFSMKIAREGAWDFAKTLAALPAGEWNNCIVLRDIRVAEKSKIITGPGFGVQLALLLVRLGELGSVSGKVQKLKGG